MFSVPENCHQNTPPKAANDETPTQKAGKGGRPRLPEGERRTHRIGVSINASERCVIEEKAEAAGLSLALYLREAGLGARLSSRINDKAYHQLSRIGVNVNQMARVANATGRLPEVERLEAILAQVLEIRKQL